MTHSRQLTGALALALAAGFIIACGDTKPLTTGPASAGPNLVVGGTPGQPDTGEVELCKHGTTASFSYTVDGGSATVVNLDDGQCVILGDTPTLGTGNHSIVITEVADAAVILDSIVVSTNTVNNPTPVRGAPILGTSTYTAVFNGDRGVLVEYYNRAAPPPPPPGNGCTFTQGYWKNHTNVWPSPYSPSATFYTSGTTWLGVLNTPARGNAYYILGYQFIAATLNSANGASLPANVQSALNDAGAYFLNPAGSSLTKNQLTALASLLDSYNNGLQGVPHCP